MRATLAYTLLRLLIFLAAALVLALFGVHGITLIVIALLISAIVSLPLLSRYRDQHVRIDVRPDGHLQLQTRRGHESRGRRLAAARCAGWSASQPPDVSIPNTACTASCRLMTDVSITSSASTGSSYGSDTPVN